MDTARCLLSDAKLHIRYWPEAVRTAAYLKNRTIANTILNKTPYEIFFGKRPSMKYLRRYGSKIFVRVPEEKRESKWDKKAVLGILVGYENVGYRVLIGQKIVIARYVDIVEEDVKLIGLDSDTDSDNESIESIESSDDEVFDESVKPKGKTVIEKPKKSSSHSSSDYERKTERHKSTREIKAPDWYGNPITSVEAPKNYTDAIESNDSDL